MRTTLASLVSNATDGGGHGVLWTVLIVLAIIALVLFVFGRRRG